MNLDAGKFRALMDPMESHLNVGFGRDITIRELAELIAQVVGFKGHIEFDSSKPDGTLRKLLDSSRLRRLGWEPRTSLEAGLAGTYEAFLARSDRTPTS
jgi:nucleoside-diphosphate-sugar epimerase